MSGYTCLNCNNIGDCTEADENKATRGYYCVRWEAAAPEVIAARIQILQDFGNQGLKSILTTKLKRRK